MKMPKPAILFLCVGNSVRSQMAEGFMKQYAKDKIGSYSAGISPGFVHPLAVEVMREKGIDISKQCSKSISDVDLRKITMVATLCGEADEVCPTFSKEIPIYQWHFPDPMRAVGSQAECLKLFRQVRDGIELKIKEFIKNNEFLMKT